MVLLVHVTALLLALPLLAIHQTTAAAAAAPRTTVLPLMGDSITKITFGWSGDSQSPASCVAGKVNASCTILQSPCAPCAYGYRYRLYEALNASRPNGWACVGTLKTGPLHKTAHNKHAADVPDLCDVPGTPCAHEGHPGWKSTDLSRTSVALKMGTVPAPDIILLHIGTNDIGEKHYMYPNATSVAAADISTNLKLLLGQLFDKAPKTHILVVSIIAMPVGCHFYGKTANRHRYKRRRTMRYQGSLAGFGGGATFVDMKQKTGLCDQNSSEPSGCCPPQLHPNGWGYAKMAAVWAKALLRHSSRAKSEDETAAVVRQLKSDDESLKCRDLRDCTAELQAALSDSNLPHVIIPQGSQPWNTLPLMLNRSNVKITLQPGAIIQSKRGFFHGLYDSLLAVQGANNVTIEGGIGSGLRMWRADFVNTSLYNHSENRHGLSISKCSNVSVVGIEIAETGGDGLYLRWIINVNVFNVTTEGAYRNGLSVISAKGLRVLDCTFANTGNTGKYNGADAITPLDGGTAPRAGVDLEPNGESEVLLNVTFRNCVARGNTGNAWDISTNTNHSILFDRCVAEDCGGGFFEPVMPSGFCSGFNFQNEIGAFAREPRLYWPNGTSGVGTIEMVDCVASNLAGAALQILTGSHKESSGEGRMQVANSFTIRNLTAMNVAQVWLQPYSAYDRSADQGFYPITIKNAVRAGPKPATRWMDQSVTCNFDGITVKESNLGASAGRPAIGCQDNTWLSSRSALFAPVPCEPAQLWRFHGRMNIATTNQSACSLEQLGLAATGLQVVCNVRGPRLHLKSDEEESLASAAAYIIESADEMLEGDDHDLPHSVPVENWKPLRVDDTNGDSVSNSDITCEGEVLYNNICLLKSFPPLHLDLLSAQAHPRAPPYLADRTRPVNISIGRQLLVDDFLLASQQKVVRRWHQGNMSDDALVRPDRPWEKEAGGLSGTGGIWYDPKFKEFRLFYNCECGEGYGFCVATSPDGQNFSKPDLDGNGTNCIVLHQNKNEVPPFDGGTIVLDLDEPDSTKRYKMAERPHCATAYQHMSACAPVYGAENEGGKSRLRFANGGYRLHASADGINWQVLVNRTGIIGDTSTIFRNPPAFRNKWVFSIKAVTEGSTPEQADKNGELGALDRYRLYHEVDDLFNVTTASWSPLDPLPHLVADALDPRKTPTNSMLRHLKPFFINRKMGGIEHLF